MGFYTSTATTLNGMAPKKDRVDDNCIYVGNLSYRTGWKKLKEHFSQAGEVEYTKVHDYGWTPFGRPWSKGTGLVEFADAASAKKAMSTLQGKELDGRELKLDPWVTGWKKSDA